jgi:hypothetical protein
MFGAVAFVVATVVELGRQSGVPAWNSIWAEDGTVFLADAWAEPLLSTITEPFNGYMLLIPRIAAEIIALFPVSDAAWLIAVLASFVIAAVALFVYHASAIVLVHRASRGALAAAVILLPAAGYEATANLANLHWYLLFACFWALLFSRNSPGVIVARTLFTLAAPLCNPIAIFLAPLLLFRANGPPRGLELVPRLGFVLGLSIQAIVVVRAPDESTAAITSQFSVQDLPSIFAVRVAGSFLIGDRFLELASANLGWGFTIGAALLCGVTIGCAARGLDEARRNFALLAGAAAVISFAVPLVIRGTATLWPATGAPSLGGARYFVLPTLFLIVVFLLGVDARLSAPPSESRTIWLSAAALWLTSLALLNYSIINPRSAGPDWTSTLKRSQKDCRPGRKYVPVPIAPGGTWTVRTPCTRVP